MKIYDKKGNPAEKLGLRFSKHHMSSFKLGRKAFRRINKYKEHIHKNHKDYMPNILYDIGANVGLYSLFYYKIMGFSYVYSFEPVANNYKVLSKNIIRNNLKVDVTIIQKGLWSKTQSMDIGFPSERKNEYKVNKGLFSVFGQSYKKKASFITLDSFCKSGIYPDFLKIDTEGAEVEILKGSSETIKKVRFVVCETVNKNYEQVCKILYDNSFIEIKELRQKSDLFFEKR